MLRAATLTGAIVLALSATAEPAVRWQEAPASARPRFTGEPLSLDLTAADLMDVIRVFADLSGLNVIVYPGVQGTVTLKVHDVPWDEVLDRVLTAQGLGYRFEGNVLRIAKPEQLGEPRQFSGKPRNFDFQGESLAEILQAFAPLSGAKVVVDPGVTGRVHAQLVEVPWDQALDIIVRANGLDWNREGDVIHVVKRAPPAVSSSELRVADASELQSAIRFARPGTTIVMKDGTWRDLAIVFDSRATADAPVRLRAQTPGAVVLTGSSSLTFAAPHLLAEGLYFKGGALPRGAVVRFASDHGRLTDSAIADYNPPDVKVEYHWILVEGSDNHIDRCHLRGKTNRRPMISIRPGGRRNRIEGCHFKDFAFVDENGRETIQIMGYGMSEEMGEDGAFATVEGNLFEEAHGEGMEIISIKSNRNVIRGNTFRKTKGGITNRSGNFNVIEGNVVLGEHEPRSYGIRVTGQHHTVADNHVENVDGPCLILVAGELIEKALTPDFQPLLREGTPLGRVPRYAQVRHGTFARNTFVDCGTPAVEIGSSYKAGWPQAQRVLLPEDNRFLENLIFPRELGADALRVTAADRAAPLDVLRFRPNVHEGNVFSGRIGGAPSTGFRRLVRPLGEKLGAASRRPPLGPADVGPAWMKAPTSAAAPAPSADRSPR